MKKQQGAALIVVLVLLVASFLLVLSSVQSALIDERLAGNYKAAAQAQMNAERAAAHMWNEFGKYASSPASDPEGNNFGFEDGLGWREFKHLAEGSSSCLVLEDDSGVPDTYDGVACHLYMTGFNGKDSGFYIVSMGAINDGEISESMPVFVKLKTGVISAVEAAISCVGEKCAFSPGKGKSGPAVDGTDRYADGKTQGSHQPEENPDGVDIAAIIMPDLGGGEGVERGGSVIGEEIFSAEEYKEYSGGINDDWILAKERIIEDIENTVSLAKSGANGFYYAGPGETISPGSVSGVVVVEGGVLELDGNDKFTGLVVLTTASLGKDEFLYGSINSSGTAAIVGAVLGKDFSYGGKGNPSVFYSSEAVSQYIGRARGDEAGLRPYGIESWQ